MRKGLSLVEILVALTVLALVLAFIVPSFTGHLQSNTSSELRSQAIALAQAKLEELRLQNPAALPSSGSVQETRSLGSRTYTVRTSFCTNAGLCASGSRHIRVEVIWNGRVVYGTETVFAQLR